MGVDEEIIEVRKCLDNCIDLLNRLSDKEGILWRVAWDFCRHLSEIRTQLPGLKMMR